MRIFVDVTFEAAHSLPNTPPQHKCHRLHGHSYQVTLEVEGEPDPYTGWIVDYAEVKDAWEPLHGELDHHFLNDVEGLGISTCENLVLWIARQLRHTLLNLCAVTVRETPTCGARWEVER